MWARVVDQRETPAHTTVGAQGPPGPKGDRGDTGPTGPAGADGTGGSGGGQLLSGTRAPLSGSGLLPLDGVNDPWRWFEPMTGWVGPAWNVTWQAGDQVGVLPPISDTNEEYALWIGSVTTPTEANHNSGDFYGSLDATPTTTTVSNIFVAQDHSPSNNPAGHSIAPGVAIADGSGIAFLFQAERDWTGPTAVPDPSWTGDLANLTAVLGTDVVIGDPFVFNEDGDGVDGDFWLNTTTLDLYGPKAGGVWPAPKNVKGFDAAAAHTLTGTTTFGPHDFAAFGAPSLLVAASDAPTDDNINPDQLDVWYESTEGAPVVHFRAKDSAGTVYVASLPMTPA